jgi:ABC-2 type transport system ATP-binding protein
MSMAHALQVQNLTKRFPKDAGEKKTGKNGPARLPFKKKAKNYAAAVDQVTFYIPRREIFGVLGANGSGKSTLIRMISTLLIPDEGSAQVFGMDVTRDSMEVRRVINRVSADASFFRRMTAMENLIHAARLYSVDVRQAKEYAMELLKGMGFPAEKVYSPVRHLSRGMQQKVAIARSFLTSPNLMLLDEPTTGLDPRAKKEVQAFIRGVRDNHDSTILLTTHDMAEAEALCDRIAILAEGKIVAMGTCEELKASIRTGDEKLDMEETFMRITGKRIEEHEIEKDD